ncbi:SUF system Fe-S cluster assembly regulator [Kiloniella laminariae]|uniref:SUF system Fe-S cluster assembly regulator n=1 Tax=Kiloniella laminariae TaxID=454162 RepID=UPI000375D4FA|nr:SUF system Fe-S cluster assembly regulator [Kiloniella laminariae]
MFRLTRLTDYAVVVLGQMSRKKERVVTALQLSEETGLPLPTVAKILGLLSRQELITSLRGAGGGYICHQEATAITVADILQAMEGPIALTACVDGAADNCTVENLCPMRGNWNRVNSVVAEALKTVTLADMIDFENSFMIDKQKPETRPKGTVDA